MAKEFGFYLAIYHSNMVIYQTLAKNFGDIIVTCGNNSQFGALCDVVNLRHLGTDPKFATNPERISNRAALTALLGTTIEGWSKNDLLQRVEKAVVPAGPINTVKGKLGRPANCSSRPSD